MQLFNILLALLLFAIFAAGLPFQGQCGGTLLCGSILNMTEQNLVSNTASDDAATIKDIDDTTSSALTPIRDVSIQPMTANGKSGWICGGKICTRNLDTTESHQIRNTATDSTTITNMTSDVTAVNIAAASSTTTNNTKDQRVPTVAVPAGWWCGTIICIAKMETVKNRQIDITASDASVLA